MIPETVADALDLLFSQSGPSLFDLFWFIVLFELPRYALPFLAAALFRRRHAVATGRAGRLSVVIAGHNEADAVRRCVLCLKEQSRPPDEIVVVSDGSTDAMVRQMRALQSEGLIDQAHATELRGGKSAGGNLGARLATGDILVNVDCDCSFDRDALARIAAPFADPSVGAVAGNLMVRNAEASVIAACQAIEYLISISLGRQAARLTDHVTCVSGAFGAFRRTAYEEADGLDAGGGEDLDLTLRLRKAGWRIEFAEDAICYTDVPASFAALVRQRFRWERDAVRLRYRKHIDLMNPFSRRFRVRELLHEIEFLVFNVFGAAALPVYILWLFGLYGGFAPVVLVAAQAGLMALDFATFVLAAHASPEAGAPRLLPFVPGYSLLNGFPMRFVRLAAYLQEWVFDASYADPFVPDKVHATRF